MESTTADYLVGETIAEGNFGRIVLATHKASKTQVVIKAITKQSTRKYPHLVPTVLTEQRLLKKWRDSDYIVSLLASFHDQECLYMVMECCRGGTLKNLIQINNTTNPINDVSVSHYGLQILSAIEFIHSHKVIHADLKPDNIFLTDAGRIRLGDFGCAIDLSLLLVQSLGNNPIIGTVDYSAPEVISGSQNLGLGVDLWSFGCILWALCSTTGESPFHDQTDYLATEKISRYNAGEYDFTNETTSASSTRTDWKDIVRCLLKVAPEERLGFSDVSSAQTGSSLTYTSIRNVWPAPSKTSNQSLPSLPLMPPTPAWLINAKKTEDLKDGCEGWTAFLL